MECKLLFFYFVNNFYFYLNCVRIFNFFISNSKEYLKSKFNCKNLIIFYK